MKISVRIRPNSKRASVEAIDALNYKVSVRSEAKEGKANEELIKILAEFFNVSKSRIEIKSGLTSRDKIIEIL